MGLDITCECGAISFRAGSYSSFHWWRVTLAKALDYPIVTDERGDEDYKVCFGLPMAIFLLHSDSSGELLPSECELLLKDLLRNKKRISEYAIAHLDSSDATYFLQKLQEWEKAFQHSVEKRCILIFY
jgi:hypothetical protein